MDLSQNQPKPPASSTNAPNGSAQGGLYAAITAEDEAPVVVAEKKHTSPFMALVVGFMKFTFWVDLTKRSNESTFKALRIIWRSFIGILYLSGLITLLLCLMSYVSLPARIESFFDEKNIKFSSLEMVDYSLTQIDIKDLHDDKNTYQIPIVHIRSTFSDFLRNKILGVEAEGVKINLDPSKTEGNDLGWLMNVFSAFNQKNPQKLSINALNISKAVLTIMGKNITIPIAFSVVGDYSQGEKTTAILFNINEEFLSSEGNLSISGEGTERNIEMTIKSGTLRLPNSPEEALEGKINILISGKEIHSIEGTLNLSYAHTKKEIQIQAKKENSGFSGELNYQLKNTASNQTEETLIDMNFGFDNLQIDNHQNLTTKAPLKVGINLFNQNNLYLSDVKTTLNGSLSCSLSQAKCEYELTKPSNLNIGIFKNNYKDQQIVFNDNKVVTLSPKEKTTFSWQLNPFTFKMNYTVKNIDSYGYLNDPKNELDLLISSVDFENVSGILENSLALTVNQGKFVSPSWQLENINLSSKNIFDKTIPLTITAEHVKTNSTLLKKPFTLIVTALSDQSVIEMKVDKTPIQLKAKGELDPLKGAFNGQFILYPFQLEELNIALNDLSDLFIEGLKEVSGAVVARGQVKINSNTIIGPIYFGLKDVHFKKDEASFTNLNTVVGLQSLKPLQSAANQPFFVEKIQSVSDLYNLTGSFQLTNKNIRFNNLEAQTANQPLFLNSAIIPLENPTGLFYFRSEEAFNINDISPYLNLPGTQISDGLGSLAVTVDVSQKGLILPAVTLKVSNAALTNPSDEKDLFNLLTTGQTRYFIRNGVLTLTKKNHLQADLDGWYLPYSQKKSFSEKDILLEKNLFEESNPQKIPTKIEELLNKVFP